MININFSKILIILMVVNYISADCSTKYSNLCVRTIIETTLRELCNETIKLTDYEYTTAKRRCCNRNCYGAFLKDYCTVNDCGIAIDYAN